MYQLIKMEGTEMKAKVSVIVLILSTFCFSQSVEELARGPINGFTETPTAGWFSISTSFEKASATSLFDEDGESITLNKLEDGDADPEVYASALSLTGSYAITNRISVGITIPFYISQGVRFDNVSPGWTGYYEDLTGETGLGDISLNGSFIIISNDMIRSMAVVGVKAATGGDPYDKDENAYRSTGTGQNDIGVGVALDFAPTKIILLSVATAYTMRIEGSYSRGGNSWDENPGDVLAFGGRFSIRPIPIIALGLDINYALAGKHEVDGESIDNSEMNTFSFTPLVGFQLTSGSTIVNLSGGYLLNLAGQNTFKTNAFQLGAQIYF